MLPTMHAGLRVTSKDGVPVKESRAAGIVSARTDFHGGKQAADLVYTVGRVQLETAVYEN